MTASCHLLDSSFRFPAADESAAAWDSQQAAAAALGDTAAFGRLMERHGSALQRFCHNFIGCAQEAEDICQETLVRVWNALPRYREKGQFRAWVWRIALNLCRDSARARSRRKRWLCVWPHDSIPEACTAASASPDEATALRCDVTRLACGMELLPESLRLPLWLFSVENLSQAECATVLGISLRAAEARIFRARQQLLDWWNTD